MVYDPDSQNEYFTFVVVPKIDDPFGAKVLNGCALQAYDLEAVTIRCVYLPPSRANATEQADLIRDVATYPEKYDLSKVDGMMISVLDEKLTGEAIDYAIDRNISVITFDSDAPKSTRLAYVGANNSDIGARIGQEMRLEDSRGGHYVIITGVGPNLELRVEGIRQALSGSTWVEFGSPRNCYENSTLALELVSDLINHSSIQGIILTDVWPTYLPDQFQEVLLKRSTKILVMGGYVSEGYYYDYFNNYIFYTPSFGSDPEEIGRQSLQLLFDTTQNKYSIYSSIYTEIALDPNDANRDEIIIIGKSNTQDVALGGQLDDLWKGCENKFTGNCQYPLAPTDAKEQAELLIGASRFTVCLAVSVLDENVTGAAINIAVDRGVRVITFESDAPNSKRWAYVGVNNFDYGVKLGEAMKKKQPRGGQYVIITDQAPNSKLHIDGVRAALKDSRWVERTSPIYGEANNTQSFQLLTDLAENSEIHGIISTEGWPMDDAKFFRKFNNEYGHKKTIIIGGRSSTQQALFDDKVVDELIGPPAVLAGLEIADICNLSQRIQVPFDHLEIKVDYQGIYLKQKYLGGLSALGYALFSIVSLGSISLLYWTLMNRTSRPVQASQPFFMAMLCIGTVIMASAMIPLSIDDEHSKNNADIACMSIPWLLSIGFCTIFSALFAKTWRLVKIVESAARFRRVTVRVKDVLYPFFGLLMANIIILACWTFIDPLIFRRDVLQDAALTSVGRCISSPDAKGDAIPYLVSLAAVNGSMLILANWMAYRSRKVHLEFGESRYIAFIMFSILQAFLIGIPLLFAVIRDPVSYYIVILMLDFIICCSTLCFMFIPKILAHRKQLSRKDVTKTSATAKESFESSK